MNFLLGFFLLFVAIGIVLKCNAMIIDRRRLRVTFSPVENKRSLLPKSVEMLLIIVAIIIIIYFVVFGLNKTYYNHHLLTLVFMSLGSLLLSVAGLLMFIPDVRQSFLTTANWVEKFLSVFFVICSLFGVSLGLFGFPPLVTENVNGLITGPEFSTGIVEGKSTDGASRTGPRFYVVISDEKYQVPDYRWWQSMEKGEEIDFAYNAQTTKSYAIFQPEKVSFSTSGILLSIVGIVLWLVAIGVALKGYGTLFHNSQYDHELPVYNDFYPRQENVLAVEAKSKQKRSSIVWVIVGGLLTILIVAWRSFRQSTKSS